MQSPAIAFLALVVAVALVLGIWDHVGPIAYQGGDGKLFQTLAATSLRFAPFLEINILNPLQGLLPATPHEYLAQSCLRGLSHYWARRRS
jgi:hypothetical protein